MSCSSCTKLCEVELLFHSSAIANPLYYTQTIGGITRFYEGISKFFRYCEWPGCERIANWSSSIDKTTAKVSYTLDKQGNYILTVFVNDHAQGQHGYKFPLGPSSSDFTCSNGKVFTQTATISNNGTGATEAELSSSVTYCCNCSHSATYKADNPYQGIEWQRGSDGCGGPASYIVCSPNKSYITIGPPRDTLCLPPDCPTSFDDSDDGHDRGTIIEMVQEVTAEKFLDAQQKVINIKKKFKVDYSNSLTNAQRTIPNPTSGGRLIRIKPSLSAHSLDKKALQVQVKNENCDTLETISRIVSPSLNEEIQINLAKYAFADENPLWGPAQIDKVVYFQITQTS